MFVYPLSPSPLPPERARERESKRARERYRKAALGLGTVAALAKAKLQITQSQPWCVVCFPLRLCIRRTPNERDISGTNQHTLFDTPAHACCSHRVTCTHQVWATAASIAGAGSSFTLHGRRGCVHAHTSRTLSSAPPLFPLLRHHTSEIHSRTGTWGSQGTLVAHASGQVTVSSRRERCTQTT